MPHLERQTLEALVANRLDAASREAAERHLQDCEACRVARDAALSVTASATPRTEPGALTRIGRYVFDGRLGAGAMGVVFSAEDPQLHRRVALKLLAGRAGEAVGPTLGAASRTQLLEEARTAARVQHPNVIAIYDVVEDGPHVALAMELVQGGSLSDWLRTPRPWRQTARLLLDTGRGLEAVHAAGLVHRDFKPANVLVGHDERPRVGDFGLAHLSGAGAGASGSIVGTPAYMSAQQLRGDAPSTADDTYAFCVTAWEALYGQRPGAAQTFDALVANASRPPPEPPASDVPVALGQALRAGLAPERSARASLGDVLSVFEQALAPRGSRVARRLAAVALGVALLTAAVVGFQRAQLDARCTGLATPERLGQTSALDGTALGVWADTWRTWRREVCMGEVEGQALSDRDRERVAFCLDDQRLAFRHLAKAVSRPGVTPEQRTALLALNTSLPAPGDCLHRSTFEQSADEAALVMQVETLRESGDWPGAIALADEALARDGGLAPRTELGLRWARGQAHRARSEVPLAMGDFTRTAALAETLHDDVARSSAVVLQASMLLDTQQFAAAEVLLTSIAPLVERSGTPQTSVDFWLAQSRAREEAEDTAGALEWAQKAVALSGAIGDARRELLSITREFDLLQSGDWSADDVARAETLWSRALVLSSQSPHAFGPVQASRVTQLAALGRTRELAQALAAQRALLEADGSPRGELLRVLADWQAVHSLGDVDAAKRALTAIPRVRQARPELDDELTVIELEALWRTRGAVVALEAAVQARQRMGQANAAALVPWESLLRFIAGQGGGVRAPDDSLPDEQRALTWTLMALDAKTPAEARAALGHVTKPPRAELVRASPEWAFVELFGVVLDAELTSREVAQQRVAALVATLEAEPSPEASRQWAQLVSRSLAPSCDAKAALAAGPAEPAAAVVVRRLCRR